MRVRRGVLLLLLVAVLSACSGGRASATQGNGVRQPTKQERAELIATVRAIWNLDNDRTIDGHRFVGLPEHGDRERVVSLRVSRSDPRFATAAAEVWDAHGRRLPADDAVILLERTAQGWFAPAGPTALNSFPMGCLAAEPRAVRELICPDPWAILGMRHKPVPVSASNAVITNRWRTVKLPGEVCGADHPVSPGDQLIHSAIWPWFPMVEVDVLSGPRLIGDVDGDGQNDVYFQVACTNGGGTVEGVLGIADVVYAAKPTINDGLSTPKNLLGIVAAREPLQLKYSDGSYPAGLARLEVIGPRANSHLIDLVSSEDWYGPADVGCCPSGRATTIWRYSRGRLRVIKTTLDLAPFAS